MRFVVLTAVLAFTTCAFGQPAASQPSGGEKVLFNGKDLTGWEGDPKVWSVKDGALTGTTTKEDPIKLNTFLIWTGGVTKDFELRCLFRLENHNSGIQYRSKDLGMKDGKRINWVVSGYQADMDGANQYTGMLYEEKGRGIMAKPGVQATIGTDGKPKVTGQTADPKEIKAKIKDKDWNEYVLICQGNHLIHKINGITTCDVTDNDEKRRSMEGILAFQVHVGPPMVVQFKDITLKELRK